jgi:large subunit ribosomal protein L21e
MAEKSRGSQHGARNKLSSNAREKVTVNEQIKDFEEGEKARIEINASVTDGRPHQRFHGRTVNVTGEQGDAYEVEFMDGGVSKTLYLKPVHLQKVKE